MKKVFLLIFTVLSLYACTNEINSPITSDTFQQSEFVATSQESAIDKIFFEKNRIVVSFKNGNGNYKDSELLLNFMQQQYGLEEDDSQNNKGEYFGGKTTVRFYTKNSKNYNSSYGENYAIFYNPTIKSPTTNTSSWVIKMDWTSRNTENYQTKNSEETLFIFNVNKENQLISQYNLTFKRIK